jgi:hypothetical protein
MGGVIFFFVLTLPESIYNPITAMGFSVMFTPFSWTTPSGKHYQHTIAVMEVVLYMFGHSVLFMLPLGGWVKTEKKSKPVLT